MTIGNHEKEITNRLKTNAFLCMIPDTNNKLNTSI